MCTHRQDGPAATTRGGLLRACLSRAGLYAITPPGAASARALALAVEAALEGGARVVQYRDKSDDGPRRVREAGALRVLCAERGVPLIVNDDVALAASVEADGVHVGLEDASVHAAREALGPERIVGATCHGSLELARSAVAAGADYVAFGSFFASPTKPLAPRAPMALLTSAAAEFDVPIVAIGGIDLEGGARLLAAGASHLAVVSGVFAAADVRAAARAYAALFDETGAHAPLAS